MFAPPEQGFLSTVPKKQQASKSIISKALSLTLTLRSNQPPTKNHMPFTRKEVFSHESSYDLVAQGQEGLCTVQQQPREDTGPLAHTNRVAYVH